MRDGIKLSIFSRDDREQAVRMERLVLAAIGSAFLVGVALAAGAMGNLPMHRALVFSAMLFVLLATGYALIGSGLNLRFADPDLTVPFLACAALAVSYLFYDGGSARRAVIAMYLITFMFGVLTLNFRKLLGVAIFYYACFVGALALRRWTTPGDPDLPSSAFGLVVFFLILAWFTALGWYIGSLRAKLESATEKMSVALSELEVLARVDALTGCYNRRHAMEMLVVESKRVERGAALSICMIDLDNFKQINDKFGHQVGDQVLSDLARVVKPLLRATDILARYGGEEFLLMLSQTRGREAMAVCERIRLAVAQMRLPPSPGDLKISVSIGVAEHHSDNPVEKTLQEADKALYEAKHRGRNCVVAAGMAQAA